MSDNEKDKTHYQNYEGAYSEESISGFALYESAVSFFKNLGVQEQAIMNIPEIILTSVGSILKQVDDQNNAIGDLHSNLAQEKQTCSRIRAQRNALRGMFERMGHDPMPGYQSANSLKALPKDE